MDAGPIPHQEAARRAHNGRREARHEFDEIAGELRLLRRENAALQRYIGKLAQRVMELEAGRCY